MFEKIPKTTCGFLFLPIIFSLLICIFLIKHSLVTENSEKNDEESGVSDSLLTSNYENENKQKRKQIPFKDDYDLNELLNQNGVDFDESGFQIILHHVQVLVFVGFGFLKTLMKEHRRTSLGFSFAISSFVALWYLFIDALISMTGKTSFFSLLGAMRANLAAASFLVSFGAVLGKLNILQIYVMAIFETPVYAANKYFIETVLLISDPSGFITIHTFGAFFSLGVVLIHELNNGPEEQGKIDLEKSSYRSNISTKLGTLFFWVFWPFFNAIQFSRVEDIQQTALNTYLAFVLSCSSVAALMIISKKNNWKLNMVYIQNATLAGGVAIGSVAFLNISPFEATIIGVVAGVLSFFSYYFIEDFLVRKLRVHDKYGVFSLHGLPGIIGGFSGALVVYIATLNFYGTQLSSFYPELAGYDPNEARGFKASYKIRAIACSTSFAFVGGILTGAFIMPALPTE